MKLVTCHIILLLACFTVALSQSSLPGKHINITSSGVALNGYDPVSYFSASGPAEGKKHFTTRHEGIVYYFSTAANRDSFVRSPSRYQPQYGGWCAFAMGDSGEKVEVDPETFKILDGKLYMVYNKFFNNTLNTWNKDEQRLRAQADKNWQALPR